MSSKLDPEALKQIQDLVASDPDWINGRRYGFSLEKLLKKHPEGIPDKLAAEVLAIPEEDLDGIYTEIVLKLRETMKVDIDE